MDFDPNAPKWQCCCCQLPTGLQTMAAGEMLIATGIAVGTAVNIAKDTQPPSVFEVCLITLMAAFAFSSALLIFGIQRHRPEYMYPSIAVRGLLIIFIQAFGVSTVVSPHTEAVKASEWDKGTPPPPATSVALRLVLLVFAMLFMTVMIFYCCYLIIRGAKFEKAFARRKQRRESLIISGMIDPDFGSRRTSQT